MFFTRLLIIFCRRDNREQELKSHIHHVVALQLCRRRGACDVVAISISQSAAIVERT
jgi:hypothetical protein